MAGAEAGTPDRIGSLLKWLDRWSSGKPPQGPTGAETTETEGEPRRAKATAEADERKARAAEKARRKKQSQPPTKPANIDLKALRLRLDGRAKAAG